MHTFHIPVLGLSYSIDTPAKVARYGISSVASIIEDGLVEQMRAFHSKQNGFQYEAITTNEHDFRAKRITAYLNLLQQIVVKQMAEQRKMNFGTNSHLDKYFTLLPDKDELSIAYYKMLEMPSGAERTAQEARLKSSMKPGRIDVNIMAKVDNLGADASGAPLPVEYSDALSALRGFALSNLESSVVLSAGYNPRLYNYIEQFPDFFPDADGNLKKQIILKVSDYRSALIQGKIMAKKGVWVSEYRVESGLNCGGHAFATDGLLLGPILEEFKQKRATLTAELLPLCNAALAAKGMHEFVTAPELKITAQGGIGTAREDEFLREYYELDGTGWGSPFLLAPEVTNVDNNTLYQLSVAKKEDYYLSGASPLGVPFNNFRKSTSEQQRLARVEKGRPGSPCYKKFLATDTEFTDHAICTASRQYQDLKIKQIKEKELPEQELNEQIKAITEKDCLCEGLSAAVLLKDGLKIDHKLDAVTICPGPNLAYFSGVFSLHEMVDHIYGRLNLLNSLPRPNMFVNEAELYIDYLKKLVGKGIEGVGAKQTKYLSTFRTNLLKGIEYYKTLVPELKRETVQYLETLNNQLNAQYEALTNMYIPQ